MHLKRLLTLLGVIFILTACGQKGPLLLEDPVKPVNVKPLVKDKIKEPTVTNQETSKE
jgi:predicted small lipoprotein YifL